uniref:Acyl-CoA dehydrogenase n=1 Tax=Archaeoglobus fulgidus TaxID=2234 RepID=A0A7C2N7W2_ARCFL
MMRVAIDPLSELKSDTAGMITRSIEEWAEKEVMPYRHEIDDRFEIAERAMKKLFVDIGMQKLVVPESAGGAGLGIEELPPILYQSFSEIGRADAGIGFVLSAVVASSASAIGSEAFNFMVEKLSSGFCRVSIVPPQFGNDDFKGFELARAVEKGDRVRIKFYGRPLNSGFDADVFVVFCNYDGVSLAVLDGKEVERGELLKTAGLNASRNCDVRIRAEVEKSRIIKGNSWKRLEIYLNLCLSSLCAGSAIDSCRIVGEWAEKRLIRGKPLKDNTVDAEVLGEVAKEAVEANMMAQFLAKTMLEDRSDDEIHAISKITALKCSRAAFNVADRAMELMASQGYAREGLLEKQWRDAKSIVALLKQYHSLLELSERFFASKLWKR